MAERSGSDEESFALAGQLRPSERFEGRGRKQEASLVDLCLGIEDRVGLACGREEPNVGDVVELSWAELADVGLGSVCGRCIADLQGALLALQCLGSCARRLARRTDPSRMPAQLWLLGRLL